MNERALTRDDVLALWDELRTMAQRLLSGEWQAQSVQASDLVLTALRRQKPRGWKTDFDEVEVTWENRAQFFGQMRRAMQQALVDYARDRKRKRQISVVRLGDLDPADFRQNAEARPELLGALDQALEVLQQNRPEWAALVPLQTYPDTFHDIE